MKWRGLPFQGDMVLATRAGLKTETRRVAKLTDGGLLKLRGRRTAWLRDSIGATWRPYAGSDEVPMPPERLAEGCPYGVPGDGLYVREAWQAFRMTADDTLEAGNIPHCGDGYSVAYAATDPDSGTVDQWWRWRPSIHMPRWASRQGLILTDVAVERVQDIDEAGAIAEGCESNYGRSSSPMEPEEFDGHSARDEFAGLWETINGPRGYGWEANPWVWRLRFELTDELPPPLDTK